MSYFVLIRETAIREVILQKRYAFNTMMGFLSFIVIFLLVYYGGMGVMGQESPVTGNQIVIGFFLFSMANIAFNAISSMIMAEAKHGMLEQLYLSPFGLTTILLARVLVVFTLAIVIGLVLLGLLLVFSGERIILHAGTFFVTLVVTIVPAVGLGLVMGGLALRFKKIKRGFQLLNLGFIALVAAPVESYSVLKLLPISMGSHMLIESATNGTRLWEFPLLDIFLAVITGVVYFGLGLVVFRAMTYRTRTQGLLDDY